MIDNNKIILEEGIKYFDFTASGLAYGPIEDKINSVLLTYANTHSEVGSNSLKTSEYYLTARKSFKKSLELNDDFYILPCGNGATAAIKKFQELMGIYISPITRERYNIVNNESVPLVIIGPFEHHSNELSYREGLCDVIRIPLNSNGVIDLEFLENTLEQNKNRELIGSFSVASNVTGILNPIESIYKLFKKYNAIISFDSAAASPYMNVNCNHFDALFLSPHKLIGGPGSCGLLIIRKSICDKNNSPTFAGGGTVDYVSRKGHEFSDNLETREDAGTPGILQFIRASLAYELRNSYGLDNIKKKELELKKYFGNSIRKIDGIELYCTQKHDKLAIFSFNVEGINPYNIANFLSKEYKIQTRAGCSCAGPYGHDLLQLSDNETFETKPGWLRLGFHYIHNLDDIDYFINSLKKCIDFYKK